jgi:hypothetical protein
VNWQSLVDGWITQLFARVNRSALGDIRAVYDETSHVIKWAVAVSGSTRKRMLFKFHVGLQTWLPPDTGLEYGSLCTFTTNAGELGVYVGDCWGRVFQMGAGDRDGVHATSSGVTAVGPIAVTSATANTVTCAGAAFPTTGAGLTGLTVAVVSSTGEWQWRRIQSNTGTAITLDTTFDTAWTTIPDTSYNVVVGGIRWYHATPWLDFGISELEKRWRHFFLQGSVQQREQRLRQRALQRRRRDDRQFQLLFPVGSLRLVGLDDLGHRHGAQRADPETKSRWDDFHRAIPVGELLRGSAGGDHGVRTDGGCHPWTESGRGRGMSGAERFLSSAEAEGLHRLRDEAPSPITKYGPMLEILCPMENMPRDVQHGLHAIPTGFLSIAQEGGTIQTHDVANWTSEIAFLLADHDNTRVRGCFVITEVPTDA